MKNCEMITKIQYNAMQQNINASQQKLQSSTQIRAILQACNGLILYLNINTIDTGNSSLNTQSQQQHLKIRH
jgi:hypothetical protein